MDKDFTEGYRLSYDKSYAVRLFRLPDADDGSIRLSIEVMMRDGGYVFFKLPDNLWLTPDNPVRTGDLLNWDEDRHILFFTTNDQAKAFIYDVALGKLVCRDIEPHDSNLEWDENKKRWMLPHVITKTYGQYQMKQVESMPVLDLNAPEADLYNLASVKDGTPGPTPRNKEEDPNHIVIETPDKGFYLLLTKVQKSRPSDPTLWEVEVIDAERNAIVTEKLPFLITGSDAIRFHKGRVHMHGVGKGGGVSNSYIFHITPKDTLTKDTLDVFVQDFAPTHPESYIWDGEFWRAVIKGKVIYPGRFYYDNMYYEKFPLCEKPLPASVLEVLPQTDELRKLIEERKVEEQKEKERKAKKEEEEYARNNTPAEEIFERMGPLNRNFRERHKDNSPKTEVKTGGGNTKEGGNFLTSNWFIVIVTALLLGVTIGIIAYTATGNHLPPVAARNLFSAWAMLITLDSSLIIARRFEKKAGSSQFSLPKPQRMIMGCSSPFLFLAIVVSISMTRKNGLLSDEALSAILLFSAIASFFLLLFGRELRRNGSSQKKYNRGCWLLWSAVWAFLLTLISVLDLIF